MISDATKIAIIKTAPTLSHIELIELVEHECELSQQRTWVGLTDEDRAQCIQATAKRGSTYELISAIETKLREKNT